MDWIKDELSKYDLKTVQIDFNIHALGDKGIKSKDLDNAYETVRNGRIIEQKSDKARKTIAFRLYFGKENLTYTSVVGLHENLLRIVTLWKDEGRI